MRVVVFRCWTILMLALMLGLSRTSAAPPVLRAAGPVLVISGVRLATYEGPEREQQLGALTRLIYTQYQDRADFLVVIANRKAIPATTSFLGYHLRVSNSVRGIGAPVFAAGPQYGNPKRLKGIVYFPRSTAFWRLPFLHELAHQWGNEAVPSTEPGHFGFCGAGSQLGGFVPATLHRVGADYQARNLAGRAFGTASNGGDSVPYSLFELYLMGLAGGGEVAPFPCAVSPRWVDRQHGLFTAQRVQTLDLTDVVRLNGVRVPAYSQSQKTYRLLVVLLSEQLPSTAEVGRGAAIASRLIQTGSNGDSSYSFFEATRGRGRLELVWPAQVAKGRFIPR